MSKKKTEKQKEIASAKPSLFSGKRLTLILFVLVFVVYGNSIKNGYALDDEFFTNSGTYKLNDYIRQGFGGIPEIFGSRTFFGEDGSGYSYRPVTASSFAIEYALFGENPQISHFISVLLYTVIILLLYALLRRWFKAQGNWFAFFITLLFLVHPLHTEVVDNIKCRDELLALLGGIGCLYFAWRYYETKKLLFLILFPLFFLFGMLSKYTIIPYTVVFPLVFYFFSTLKPRQILFYTLPLLACIFITVAIQQLWLPAQERVFQLHENPFYTEHVGLFTRIATASFITGKYLLLHIFPNPLLYYYGYREVDVVGFDNVFAIIAFLFFAGIIFIAFRELRKKTILSFAILFFGLHIAAYSNLLRPAPGLMAERYTLSASLGFCIFVVWLLFRLQKQSPETFSWAKNKAGFFVFGIALLFGIRTIVRNNDWADKMTLYNHDMEYLGESAKANMLLGGHLADNSIRLNTEAQQFEAQGVIAEAQPRYIRSDSMLRAGIAYMEQAVSIDPGYTKAWNNLGSYYYLQGNYPLAISTYKKSIVHDSSNHVAWLNMGLSYANLKKTDSAESCYRRAIAIDSAYMQSYQALAQVLTAQEKTPEAIRLLQRAIKKNPRESDIPLESLAKIILTRGDTVAASLLLAEAAFVNPKNVQRLRNLADYFNRNGNQAKANALLKLAKEQEEITKRSYSGRKAKKLR